jgi:D-sedoheptulose 7-phosphate isomerase
LVAALVSNLGHNRVALPAEALTTYSSISTAIGNDYDFEHIFLK